MKLSSSVKLTFDELKQLSSKTSYSETSPSEYCGESLRRCGERVAFSPHVVKPVSFDDELSCSRAASCGYPFYCASYDEERCWWSRLSFFEPTREEIHRAMQLGEMRDALTIGSCNGR